MTLLVVDPGAGVRPAEAEVAVRVGAARRVVTGVLLVVLVALSVAWPRSAMGQTVVMRAQARVAEGRPVCVGDVAEVTGDGAEKVTGVQVGVARAGESVDVAAVRAALEKAGVNLGRVVIRGGACVVREAAGAVPAPPVEAPVIEPVRSAAPAPDVRVRGTGTLRALIPSRVAEALGVAEIDMKISFDHGDAPLLDAVVEGRRVVIRPTGDGERMPLSVRVYEGDRLVESGTVRVGVLVRREVWRAVGVIARGTTLTRENTRREEAWLASGERAAGEESLGQVVRSRVEPGEVVKAADVELPIVIKRGDTVNVDCISGGFVVQTTARAMEAGREGQVIDLQPLNSKSVFRGRVSRAGQAVMVLDRGRGTEP